MSAFGTKQTWQRRCLMTALGVKRTSCWRHGMSANGLKGTLDRTRFAILFVLWCGGETPRGLFGRFLIEHAPFWSGSHCYFWRAIDFARFTYAFHEFPLAGICIRGRSGACCRRHVISIWSGAGSGLLRSALWRSLLGNDLGCHRRRLRILALEPVT